MRNRKQKTTDKTLMVLGISFAIALIVMVIALCIPKEQTRTFTPPPFESAAVTGIPEVPEELGYSAPYQDGMSYRFAVCGNVLMDGRRATVYLTNPEENSTWIKLRVYDENGSVLGETGLLMPGEYVQYVMLDKELTAGTPIKLKIMGYEPDTYTSAGSVVLNTAVGGTSQ